MRSLFCNLLKVLYVDHEPRRATNWPELCKVVRIQGGGKGDLNITQMSEDTKFKGQDKNEQKHNDPLELPKLKENILSFFNTMQGKIQEFCQRIHLSQGPNEKKDGLLSIYKSSHEVYNEHTFSMIKLFEMLVQFDKYHIFIGNSEQQTAEYNSQLFTILKNLVSILEFDTMYPECRMILVHKRKEQEQQNKIKLNLFDDDDEEEDALVQKHDETDELPEDPATSESYIKQVSVITKMINNYMNTDENPHHVQIKLEICKILNIFLDFKMDFYLNNLKNKFTEWVFQLEIYNDIETGKRELDKKEDIEYFKSQFRKKITKSISVKKICLLYKAQTYNQFQQISPSYQRYQKPVLKQIRQILPSRSLWFEIFMELIQIIFNKKKSFGFSKFLLQETEGLSKELQALNINKIIGFEIFPSLLSIFCTNQNIDLETEVLTILTRFINRLIYYIYVQKYLQRFYNQIYEFSKLYYKLLLLFDDINIRLFKKCKKYIKLLAKNVDEAETWVPHLEQEGTNHMRTLERTMSYFLLFTDLMYEGSVMDQDNRAVVESRGTIDPIRQDIMRHLKVDKLGVDLVKDSVFMVDQVDNQMVLDKLKEMFSSVFHFLTLFVKNNPTNQAQLSTYIVSLVSNLHTDLGQVELFCELFKNNRKICLERANDVLVEFIKLIIHNGRQARYLKFFTVIQRIRSEYLSINQKAVLNLFIDPRYKQHVFYMNPPTRSVPHPTFDFEPKMREDNPNYKDEPYIYHAQMLDLLAQCTIGKDGLLHSENKLKAQVAFKYIIDLLLSQDTLTEPKEEQKEKNLNIFQQQFGQESSSPNAASLQKSVQFQQEGGGVTSSKFQLQVSTLPVKYSSKEITQMKSPLLDLISYTYLESEKISDDIFRCLPEINELIRKETKRLSEINVERVRTDFPEYQEYLFTHLMLMLNGMIKVFIQQLGEQTMTGGSNLAQLYQQFQNEIDNFRSCIVRSGIIQMVTLNSWQEKLLNKFIIEHIMQEEQNKLNEEEQAQVDQQQEERQRQLLNKNLPKKAPTLKPAKTVKMSNRIISVDQIWKELWKVFIAEFLDSKNLQDEIQAEQRVFAKAIFTIEDHFAKDPVISQLINKPQIFKSLIHFLEKSSAQPEIISTFKLVLKVLGNYIDIIEVKKSQDMDEKELLEKKKQIMTINQDFLNNQNAMQMVLQLLSDYSEPQTADSIFNNLVEFAIKMIEGGNNEVQQSIWSYFENYPTSEVFFMRLEAKIDKIIGDLKKEQQPEEVRKYEFERETVEIWNILRMLQLFAEGHYTVLQEYVHNQHTNYHSYDIIQDMIELLNAYMKNIQPGNFQIMIQNFDTLTEYIQGPCHVNQQALLQGNFLDLATKLLLEDEILGEINEKIEEQRKLQEDADDFIFNEADVDQAKKKDVVKFPRWMYARLKYKCSITLISLLEARVDDDIVQRMMKSLNIEVIRRNIADIYFMFIQQYKEVYSPAAFNHFVMNPSLDASKEDIDFASFIMETGFNLFIILSVFQEVKMETEGKKQSPEEKQEEGLSAALMNTLIGKIYQLVINILISIQETSILLKNKMQQAVLGDGERNYEEEKKIIIQQRIIMFKKARRFFLKHTAHIEVLRDDKKTLEKCYFYIPPFCLTIDDETKKKFNETANRASIKSKVTSLQEQAEEIIKVMKLNYQIQVMLNQIKLLAVIVENIQLLRDLEFLLVEYIYVNCPTYQFLYILLLQKERRD